MFLFVQIFNSAQTSVVVLFCLIHEFCLNSKFSFLQSRQRAVDNLHQMQTVHVRKFLSLFMTLKTYMQIERWMLHYVLICFHRGVSLYNGQSGGLGYLVLYTDLFLFDDTRTISSLWQIILELWSCKEEIPALGTILISELF